MKLEKEVDANELYLYADISKIIESSRQRLATTINAEICLTHWRIGKRIKEDVLYNKRAEYGKHIITKFSEKLTM